MFLHAGASLHGHEYSNRQPSTTNSQSQSPAHLRGPLLRSAFSPAKQRARAAADGTLDPVRRQRPASDYIPRDPSPVVRFREPQDDPPPTPSTHDESISESELSDVTLSIDGAVSARSLRARRPRRVRAKSTLYYLGYPAPRIIGKTKVVQKVFLPRLLLQLQKVSEDGKSRPVLELFPASRIAGPVVAPRSSKRFPHIFGVKRHLGYDDIVLVRRDDGGSSSEGTESENDEGLERRNLLAVYSPLRHSEGAEIVLHDGSVWVANPLPNGSFDFVHTDAEGNRTTARWARRHAAAATPTTVSTDTSAHSAASPQTRYTFSILDPSTRRHPVMATLTPSTLDVQDSYTSVSPSHSRHPPITRAGRSTSVTSSLSRTTPQPPPPNTPAPSSTSDGENDSAICLPSPDYEPTQRTTHQIDDPTKMLIAATALWVALRPDWGRNPHTTSHDTTTTTSSSSSSSSPPGRSRRHTWNSRSSTDTPRPSDISGGDLFRAHHHHSICGGAAMARYSLPAQQQHPFDNNHNGIITGTNRSSTPVSRSPTPVSDAAAAAGGGGRPLPKRAASSGGGFMQRRLLSSSSFSSSSSPRGVGGNTTSNSGGSSGERDIFCELVTSPRQGTAAAGLALPVQAGEDVFQTKLAGVGGAERAGERIHKKKAGAGAESREEAGGGRKMGVRGRLARWFHHRLGTSSSPR